MGGVKARNTIARSRLKLLKAITAVSLGDSFERPTDDRLGPDKNTLDYVIAAKFLPDSSGKGRVSYT